MKKITNFALHLDAATKEQFEHCCSQDYVISASLMPDAHSGYVAPIGSVLITKEKIVPAWVGYDIGCGMIACRFTGENILEKLLKKKQEVFSRVNSLIPMGKGNIGSHGDVSLEIREKFRSLVQLFKEKEYDFSVFNFINTQAQAHLGSLGSGNHFIEIGSSNFQNKDEFWLIIHSGSRGVGHKVAREYMKIASGDSASFEKTAELFADSKIGKEYLNVVSFGQEFALLNRLEMASRVREALREVLELEDLDFELICNKNHNFIEKISEGYVHRKGATPAKNGEIGVIPANMRDGSFIVKGLGNKDFLESSSHGAGRKLSRVQARKNETLGGFKKIMQGIVANVSEKTLDENPNAYKNIYDVMEKQKNSVEVKFHIKPIINWKGS